MLVKDHPEVKAIRGTVEYWNFLPPGELDELLNLFKKVSNKTLLISKTLGIEGKKLLRPEDDFAALKDFDHITVAVQSPNVLVVPANSPHKTLADVVAYQKANPGKMTFASAGNGSSDHLTVELFWQETNTKGIHVPYKGGAPAHTDLMGGQVDASFQNVNSVLQYIKGGKMRPQAVTSAKRSPVLPDVPTMAEAGVPNVEVTSWQAIVAPKGLPPAVREKAHAAFAEALNSPKVKDQFTSIGFEMVVNTPAEFAAFQQKEYARWKKVIETGKISIE